MSQRIILLPAGLPLRDMPLVFGIQETSRHFRACRSPPTRPRPLSGGGLRTVQLLVRESAEMPPAHRKGKMPLGRVNTGDGLIVTIVSCLQVRERRCGPNRRRWCRPRRAARREASAKHPQGSFDAASLERFDPITKGKWHQGGVRGCLPVVSRQGQAFGRASRGI